MINFQLKLESVPSGKSAIGLFSGPDKQDQNPGSSVDGFEVLRPVVADVTEHLLYLEAHHDLGEKVGQQQAEFIVVVDRSGSMQGGPWRQVQGALVQMLGLTKNNSNCRAMEYNQAARIMDITGDMATDKATINGIRAGGSTNFVSVFEELGKFFKSGNEDSSKSYFIFLMTDGQDTCNNRREIMKGKEMLQMDIEKFGAEVVFNVLGFGEDHDEDFLESLTLMGTADGSYSYVSPSEGDKALEERLVEMVQTASGTVGRNINIELVSDNVEFLGDWFGESDKDVVLPAMLTTKDGMTKMMTRKFVKIRNGEEPNLTIRVFDKLSGVPKPMEAKIGTQNKLLLTKQEDIDGHNLRKLRTAMNMITQKMSEVGEGKEEDEVKAWYKIVKSEMEKMLNVNKDIPEISRLHKILTTGLEMCELVLEPGRVRVEERGMTKKAITHNYQMKSKNVQNMKKGRKNIHQAASTNMWIQEKAYKRSSLQKKTKQTDYTMDSDEEEA